MARGLTLSTETWVQVEIVAAAVMAVLLVALSTYGRRCRHPALRFFVWGASMAFLPLTSSIISSLMLTRKKAKTLCEPDGCELKDGKESTDVQIMWTVLLWTVLILHIKGNADTAAAAVVATTASPTTGDVSIDGQKVRPRIELLAQYVWLGFLIVQCITEAGWLKPWRKAIFIAFSMLGVAKLALKVGAAYKAGGSFALGKNARLVSGYMAQLVEDGEEEGHGQVPRYIVMGEKKKHVEESPQGYRIKREVLDDKHSDLITLDRVWRLSDHGDGLLAKRQELRDLCLSYSLFKSLRRWLSGYPLAEAGTSSSVQDFVIRGMHTAGKGDADRVFRVLVDELWFASDFYYSSLPLCSFSGWCAILNYLFSALIVIGAITVGWIYKDKGVVVFPDKGGWVQKLNFVITFSLLPAVVLIEAWEIVAGVCSNWTKMALLGSYITRGKSLWPRSALETVLRLRPARRWSDTIRQNSVLEPGRFLRRSGLFSEKLYGGAGLMRSVEVSPAVKDAVLGSLKRRYGRMDDNGSTGAWRVGGKVDWDSDRSTTENILVWHVGTRLFEIKYSHAASPTSATAADRIAACHLSYYCAYLVAAAPGLLPDSPAWTEKRYKDVVGDVKAALGGDGGSESTAQRYEQLVKALSAGSRDKVLRRGAEIGRRLVEEYMEDEDEVKAWRFLANFWSEMVLFVAPSENVKGHVEAMACGGEFVTLVWALLLHAGVTARPETPVGSIP